MFRRVFFFMLTNIMVLVTIGIITNLLGVNRYITKAGLDYNSLLFFCLIYGMGASVISLLLSKFMAKMMMGVKVIDPQGASSQEMQLIQEVHGLAQAAGITKMPEVGIYDSPEVNAFATGPSKNNSLVAVSSGLLQTMNRNEVRGVLSHEIAHIANGDMVTMTLIQGVVNAFTMFLARIIAFAVTQAMASRSDNESNSEGFSHLTFMIVSIVLDIVFSILGSIVVAYFSRIREYRADNGGAQYGGRENMIAALEKLQRNSDHLYEGDNQAAVATLKISSQKSGGLMALFSTHPPLTDRIAALK